ncbi:FAD-dependent oxidoreductase [Phenylobacterium sp. 58.2.17]|uniref:FAD-dependent oxidoreductase n=1 Tax=Phenylobacterium sp. 58.2.17 TaxID=2969306 RepID=UPI002265483E|nr:FAD-dependent oxidoreductase [Phenylobacterium sp. 58.2.17]MCX7584782.1 FAD-dependent oxidoreductase [Phenylobacterium sp. 58.2.17]
MHTRRNFGLMLGAGALAGCTTTGTSGFSDPLQPAGPLRLAPVHVSEDRVIRVVAGLRPFRPGGFVVRAEPFGRKTLVHNYGHGGGGITLSWGTSHMAVDLGFAGPERDYAVLGCGAVGLATARLIQRRGGRVTIYARALPPETTSNIAGGQWWPASVYDSKVATPQFLDQLVTASKLSYRHFQQLSGPEYGVRWTRNYVVDEDRFGSTDLFGRLAEVAPELKRAPAGEHPFGALSLQYWDGMMVEPPIYLQAMMEDVLTAGGKIVVRDLKTPADVQALAEPVVFNCTGLGAGELFGDKEITPARGQLVVLLPQPEVTYNLMSGRAYMFPRRDGIILGGSFDRGDWSTEPDGELTKRILADHKAMFAKLKA